MKSARMIVLFLALMAGTVAAAPRAWRRLDHPEGKTYLDTPYHWLGDAPLFLRVDVVPADGLALDLLWGAKNDERGAEITIDGTPQMRRYGGFDGFRWHRLALPGSGPNDHYEVSLKAASPKAAFFAAVRVVDAETPLDAPLPEGTGYGIAIVEPPPHPLETWRRELETRDPEPWERARIHGCQANEALRRCRRYVDGWLAYADPDTGLIPENLTRGRAVWNGRNAAADNYAFMVLTCAFTDTSLLHGRMLDMLRTETERTSRRGSLPDHYNFETQAYHYEQPDLGRMIFDGSEYVKDGLMPITEWLGPTPWSERMIGIVDSILEHAPVETPHGPIPADNVEVNGEMMQVLSRLCFMTGNSRYLDMACRLADHYLLGTRHPTRDAHVLKLRDHGCELVSGLTEVYAACHALRPERAETYRQPIHTMLDRILEVGVNEHGLMFDAVNPATGAVIRDRIGDNWGYNYNGFYTVYLLDGIERYREATRRAMANLKPHYWEFAWQGWGADGIADSVEGAINLLNREPDVNGVPDWIDANITRMLLLQKADGIVEGWHGDGNYARTAILWVLWKQQGVTIQPWREDVTLGAASDGENLHLLVTAATPWQGRLVFDQPRHRTIMHLPLDYPRINQFPEWFTTKPSDIWQVNLNGRIATYAGFELIDGLTLTVEGRNSTRITVSPAVRQPR